MCGLDVCGPWKPFLARPQVGNAAARAVPAQQASEREHAVAILPTTCASIVSSASGISFFITCPSPRTALSTASSRLPAPSPLHPPLYAVAPAELHFWSDDIDALSRQATPNLPLQRYTRGLEHRPRRCPPGRSPTTVLPPPPGIIQPHDAPFHTYIQPAGHRP